MIIIADSGSTKTDWRIVPKNGKIIQIETIGLNPHHVAEEKIAAVFKDEVLSQINNISQVTELFFYGAGCKTEHSKQVVKSAFQNQLENAEVIIEHDLLGAARATCKNETGMVAILGTGSNSCIYDGKNVVADIPAPGYLFGDEGGGADMGKKLLSAYIYNEMPKSLREAFEKYYATISYDVILDNVYRKPFPNRYLGTFSRFLYHKRNDEFAKSIIIKSFDDFFEKNILKYNNYQSYTLHAVGSVAMHFYEFLHFVAEKHGVAIGNIIEKPIAGLTLYHEDK